MTARETIELTWYFDKRPWPKDRAFFVCFFGPQFDMVSWSEDSQKFHDYFHGQPVHQERSFAWADLPDGGAVVAVALAPALPQEKT